MDDQKNMKPGEAGDEKPPLEQQDPADSPGIPEPAGNSGEESAKQQEAAPSGQVPEEKVESQALSAVEKYTLLAIAILFLGLGIWGVVWLKQQNAAANKSRALKLPAKGRYATVSKFSTCWKKVTSTQGIKFGAVVIPSASITLGDDSDTGALRIYFRNAHKDGIGDPVTISFQDGKFLNGTDTIEIMASDGFHSRVDFETYQLEKEQAWEIELLEAPFSTSPRSGFIPVIKTRISPRLR